MTDPVPAHHGKTGGGMDQILGYRLRPEPQTGFQPGCPENADGIIDRAPQVRNVNDAVLRIVRPVVEIRRLPEPVRAQTDHHRADREIATLKVMKGGHADLPQKVQQCLGKHGSHQREHIGTPAHLTARPRERSSG